jgi:hypothetical protein
MIMRKNYFWLGGQCFELPGGNHGDRAGDVIGDKAEQAYRRGDALEKRRKLMIVLRGGQSEKQRSDIATRLSFCANCRIVVRSYPMTQTDRALIETHGPNAGLRSSLRRLRPE